MSWKLIDKPKTIQATKNIVTKFVTMEAPPHDRPLSPRRMEVYRRAISENLFRPVTWAECFCKDLDINYRINGKHTSLLLSELDPLPIFYVTIESYEAETLEDVAKLYSTFDSQTQLRTARDINKLFAGSIPELRSIRGDIINLAVAGIAYVRFGESTYDKTAAERAEVLVDNIEFVIWLNDILSEQKGVKYLFRLPVVSSMLMTWEKSHKAASDFWCAVRDETGSSPELPDRKLAKWLLSTSPNNGKGARKPLSRKADNREFLYRCLSAWNAYRKNKPTELKYFSAADLPKVI